MQDDCKQGSPDLALSLLRVGCTMPALRGSPLGAALLESLVVSVMESQHCTPPEDRPRLSGPGDNHPGRRSSYTEQALAAAVETSAPSGTVSQCPHAPFLAPSTLRTDPASPRMRKQRAYIDRGHKEGDGHEVGVQHPEGNEQIKV